MNYEPRPPKMAYLFGDSFFDNGAEQSKQERKEAFDAYLRYLSDGNTKAYSFRRVGLTAAQIAAKRASSSEFAALEERALEEGVECLVQEAVRRGTHGTEEAVYYKGEIVGVKRNYSDALLQFILRAKDPAFRETRNVVTADVNSTVSAGVPKLDMTKYTEDELLQLEELLSRGANAES